MASVIRFGTDGWRAIIAQDFTFANVARCAQGLVDYLNDTGIADRGLVVGYDTRFLSREFAETVACVCAGNGVRAWLTREAAPTPVVSFSVLDRQAAGAAIITASTTPVSGTASSSSPSTPAVLLMRLPVDWRTRSTGWLSLMPYRWPKEGIGD